MVDWRARVTHTRKSRTAFDGYNRGLHWDRTCAEIVKLRLSRGPRDLKRLANAVDQFAGHLKARRADAA